MIGTWKFIDDVGDVNDYTLSLQVIFVIHMYLKYHNVDIDGVPLESQQVQN